MRKKIKRWIIKGCNALMFYPRRLFDDYYLVDDIPMSNLVKHSKWREHIIEIGNKPGMRILEIGSRDVTGTYNTKQRFSKAEYVGFDYYAGPNVDVVGDAHKLSEYFDKKFDIIFSSAVFEHLAMPWVVAIEISKILKVGGFIFIETHFSFSSHERPWHFFHYTDMALRTLFSPALGFRCIEAGMSNPIVGRFSTLADDNLKNIPVKGMYCHVEYFGCMEEEVSDFEWEKIELEDVVGDTKYPEPKHKTN